MHGAAVALESPTRAHGPLSAPALFVAEEIHVPSPSPLPETARVDFANALDARLADGLDLQSQIKVAHWNIKGPHFAALHPLFETFATGLASGQRPGGRARVTLGRQATARPPRGEASTLPGLPQGRPGTWST